MPDSDVIGRRRCPWCRGQLDLEFGAVILRCVECGTAGALGDALALRGYPRGSLVVMRAVCANHVDGGGPAGSGPVTTRPGA